MEPALACHMGKVRRCVRCHRSPALEPYEGHQCQEAELGSGRGRAGGRDPPSLKSTPPKTLEVCLFAGRLSHQAPLPGSWRRGCGPSVRLIEAWVKVTVVEGMAFVTPQPLTPWESPP